MSITIKNCKALKFFASIQIILLLFISSACRYNSDRSADNFVVSANSPQPIRVSAPDADAAEPAMATSPDGSVYVVWVNHVPTARADVMLARLTTAGEIEGAVVRVNPESGMATAWRGDPPTVVVGPDHTVYVGWTARVESDSGHATVFYVSASRDHGQTFGNPTKVNDDAKPGVHGMHSLAVGNDGRIFVAWLDERNLQPMPMEGMKMDGKIKDHHVENNRELFFSSSADGGQTFAVNQSVARDVCPCCKTALAAGPDGRVYLSWRQVLPEDFRHIAVTSSANGGKTFADPVIVSDDQWLLKGCPVSGAAMSSQAEGHVRVLWYAGAENGQQGIYWSESLDGGKSFNPRKLLAQGFAHSTPVLTSDGLDISQAVWEATANGKSEVHSLSFGNDQGSIAAFIVPNSGELPAAVGKDNKVLIAYVMKEGEKRGVWLQTIARLTKES